MSPALDPFVLRLQANAGVSLPNPLLQPTPEPTFDRTKAPRINARLEHSDKSATPSFSDSYEELVTAVTTGRDPGHIRIQQIRL